MLAVSLVLGSFLIVLFLIVGVVIGWVAREYMMSYREIPRIHPEMFDSNGQLIPDEVLAIRFEEGFFDSDEENDEED
jgi:hypothetical protein